MASKRKAMKNHLIFFKKELDLLNEKHKRLHAGFIASQAALDRILSYTEPKFPNLIVLLKNMRKSTEGKAVKSALKEIDEREAKHRKEIKEIHDLAEEMKNIMAGNTKSSDRSLATENLRLRKKLALLKVNKFI